MAIDTQIDIIKYATMTNNRTTLSPKAITVCSLCKRMKQINSYKYNLCITCYKWVVWWIKKHYGFYSKNRIPEAIIAWGEPDTCEGCGEKVVIKTRNDSKRKKTLCPKCKKIFKDAYKLAYDHRRSGRFQYGENFNDEK